MIATLLDPEISRTKLRREMELWKANAPHRARGWLLLEYDEEKLQVEIGFLAKISTTSGVAPLPVMVCAVRISYDNYDLWAPSVTFIDVFTRAPTQPPVRAIQISQAGARDVLIDTHPDTQAPFLCIPGIREYHSHPQHSGDEWLLHRSLGQGSLSTLCDRIWHYMVRNVLGINVQLQSLPTWPLQAQVGIQLTQGDIDKFRAAARGSLRSGSQGDSEDNGESVRPREVEAVSAEPER